MATAFYVRHGQQYVQTLHFRRRTADEEQLRLTGCVVPDLDKSRWLAAFFVLLTSYAFHRATAHTYSLASIGLISLVAVAQFAPALIIGLYWRRAHRYGALAGLLGGALVWIYAMVLPSLPGSLWHVARFGASLFDPLTTTVAMSLIVNVVLLVERLAARTQQRARSATGGHLRQRRGSCGTGSRRGSRSRRQLRRAQTSRRSDWSERIA